MDVRIIGIVLPQRHGDAKKTYYFKLNTDTTDSKYWR